MNLKSQRLKLTVAYDGRPFSGWQSQANGRGVQDALELALGTILGQSASVQGSGRTDAGVHALAQTAHVDVPYGRMKPTEWRAAINGHLPREVRVTQCRTVSPNFHARFDATGKTYRYRIWNGPVFPPLELGRAWHVYMPIDIDLLKASADLLIGTHNFAGFAANRGPKDKNTDTVRNIKEIGITGRTGGPITLTFTGTGFLYKMVRLLTGSMVRVAQGKAHMEWLSGFLSAHATPQMATLQIDPAHSEVSPSKPSIKTSFAAPAEGLYLVKVTY